jgi:hypothetical protein
MQDSQGNWFSYSDKKGGAENEADN